MPSAKPGRKGTSSRAVCGSFKVSLQFVNIRFVRSQTESRPFTLKMFLTRSLSESCPINKLWNDEKTGASSSLPETNNVLSSQCNNYKAA